MIKDPKQLDKILAANATNPEANKQITKCIVEDIAQQPEQTEEAKVELQQPTVSAGQVPEQHADGELVRPSPEPRPNPQSPLPSQPGVQVVVPESASAPVPDSPQDQSQLGATVRAQEQSAGEEPVRPSPEPRPNPQSPLPSQPGVQVVVPESASAPAQQQPPPAPAPESSQAQLQPSAATIAQSQSAIKEEVVPQTQSEVVVDIPDESSPSVAIDIGAAEKDETKPLLETAPKPSKSPEITNAETAGASLAKFKNLDTATLAGALLAKFGLQPEKGETTDKKILAAKIPQLSALIKQFPRAKRQKLLKEIGQIAQDCHNELVKKLKRAKAREESTSSLTISQP